jgi:hypothetical protein
MILGCVMRNEKSRQPYKHVSDELNSVHNVRFDYSLVTASLARFLRGQAERIRRQCASSTLQIGRALLEAKRHLSHGAFLQWVESEVCIPARTAQAYMRVASWSVGKGAAVAHLSPSVLYLLSASNTPNDFVTSVLNRAEAGEYISPSVMREELKTLRAPRAPEIDSLRLAATGESGSSSPLKELVSILFAGLSQPDFERVREILTSDAVIGDPHLPQNLMRAFKSEAQVFMLQVSQRASYNSLELTA